MDLSLLCSKAYGGGDVPYALGTQRVKGPNVKGGKKCILIWYINSRSVEINSRIIHYKLYASLFPRDTSFKMVSL